MDKHIRTQSHCMRLLFCCQDWHRGCQRDDHAVCSDKLNYYTGFFGWVHFHLEAGHETWMTRGLQCRKETRVSRRQCSDRMAEGLVSASAIRLLSLPEVPQPNSPGALLELQGAAWAFPSSAVGPWSWRGTAGHHSEPCWAVSLQLLTPLHDTHLGTAQSKL